MDFDYTLKAPFTMIISGATQSGKSTLTRQILERRLEIMDPPIDEVMYLYTEWQPKLFGELQVSIPNIVFHQGLPDEIADEFGRHKLVVCDDLMTEMAKSDDAVNLFIRGSHHRNISVLFLIQNFFYKNLRTLTTNAKYIVLMKNPRENGFASVLGRQMNGGKRNAALEYAYKECMTRRYGYLVIDYGQEQDDACRLRSSLFPENMIVYMAE